MDEVLAVAEGGGRFLASPGTDATVFTARDLSRLKVRTLPELLEAVSSVSVAEKGTPGSQADLSIRGSTAEGVLLLVDGIPARDPQTGHFLMDVPVVLEGVERVEVFAGGGSTIYGASASGGIVNIVTGGKPGARVSVSAGSFGTFGTLGSYSTGGGERGVSCAFSRDRSDGYLDGMDLDSAAFEGTGRWTAGVWTVRGSAGILQKEFGAKGFYGPYPSLETVLGVRSGFSAVRADSVSLFRLSAGARGHGDEFVLWRDDPSRYQNTHYNRGYTAGGEYTRMTGGGSYTAGIEAEHAGITSGRLGSHAENAYAVRGEYRGGILGGSWSAGIRFDRGLTGENVVSPAFGIRIPVSGVCRLRARVERSFRSPTFTERYYSDPANYGNPDLDPERSISVEGGLDRTFRSGDLAGTVFLVRTSRVIDWTRDAGETVWNAVNHGTLSTMGAEFRCAVSLARGWQLSGGYTRMRQDVAGRRGMESKYALRVPDGALALTASGPLSGGVSCAMMLRSEHIRGEGSHSPVGIRFSGRIGMIDARVGMLNILNDRYDEVPGLRAPGRRFTVEMGCSR